jgi:T5SS/PEP-CTERM-associated repeat protein/autotransporter-associated beta strand protein
MKLKSVAGVLAFFVVVFGAAPGWAQTYIWVGNGDDGTITALANWQDSAAPGFTSGTENVVFNDGPSTAVLLGSTSISLNNLSFSGSTAAYSFSGTSLPALTVNGDINTTAANPNPVVFGIAVALSSSTHTINLVGGSSVNFAAAVSGNGASIAKTGAGTLTISGAATYDGGTTVNNGTLAVNGGSISHPLADLVVGQNGGDNGTLAITNLGSVSSNNGYIGNGANSIGAVTIDGPASGDSYSIWTLAGGLYVGESGTGSLALNGYCTELDSTNVVIGDAPVGSGTVTIDNGLLDSSGGLVVGKSGTGMLVIKSQYGQASGTNIIIGDASGSHGTVTMDQGILYDRGALIVGNYGTGTLTVANGGLVRFRPDVTPKTITLGANGGTGTLNIGATATDTVAKGGGALEVATVTTGTGTGILQFNTTADSSSSYYFTKDGTSDGTAVIITGPTDVVNTGGYNVLTGANTYFGTTTVNGGTLAVDGGSIGSSGSPSGNIVVGAVDGDSGTLAITNGGSVNSTGVTIGRDAYSWGMITVDGSGSSLNASDNLVVGGSGNGTLAITNGGSVDPFGRIGVIIGDTTWGNGTVTVDGPGSSLTSSYNLTVGNLGSGALTVSNGGAVNVNGGAGTIVLGANNDTEMGYAGSGALNIGAPAGWTAAAPGILNVAAVTTGDGYGVLQFNTTSAPDAPYYFTQDGTGSGATIGITGATQVISTAGYNVLTGTYSYTGSTTVNNGTLELRGGSIGSSDTPSGDFFIGDNYGDNGTFAITHGGAAYGNSGYIGNGYDSIGTVTVSGAGSNWNTSYGIYVGNYGTGTLSITNGGTVTNNYWSYVGNNSGSVGTVTVDGPGSSWTDNYNIYVGNTGTGTLTISNGGMVTISNGGGTLTLGFNYDGDSHTAALGTLNIGASAGNPAAAAGVLNAATVTTGDGTGIVQFNTTAGSRSPYYFTNDGTSDGSAVVITGPTQVINTAGYNVLTGQNTYTGSTTVNNGVLSVTNGGSIGSNGWYSDSGYSPSGDVTVGDVSGDNGTLVINNGGSVTSTSGYIGNDAGSTGTVTVDGSTRGDSGYYPSVWDVSGSLYVGNSGTGTLALTNGAEVDSYFASIGNNAGSTGTVTVDTNGYLYDSGTLFVGHSGTGTLTITNGGEVDANFASIGKNSSGSGTISVANGGSFYVNGNLYLGDAGYGALSITNGGYVSTGDAYIGRKADGSGTAIVSGSGSVWDVGSDSDNTLTIGGLGTGSLSVNNGGVVNSYGIKVGEQSGGTLSIASGGKVNAYDVSIGDTADGFGTVAINGNGSALIASDKIDVGNQGLGTLQVKNNGAATANYIDVGLGGTGTLSVSNGGVATANTDLGVGIGDGSTGTLSVTNGGVVNTSKAEIGINAGSLGSVMITGYQTGGEMPIPSLLNVTGDLYVGEGGTGLLTIANHGTVRSSFASIGDQDGSNGTVTVNAGLLNNSGYLYVGNSGGGTLSIMNGGEVDSGTALIGTESNGSGAVTVNGSDFYVDGNLVVGASGTGSLSITNFGDVTSHSGYIGIQSTSSGIVTVNSGSSWSMTNDLYVGDSGNGTLSIANGSLVSNNYGYVGENSDGVGKVTVNGTGSTWTNNSGLIVGDSGTGTLAITNGGVVSSSGTAIGDSAGGSGTVNVGGAGSSLTSTGFDIGINGATGSLAITNGGTVLSTNGGVSVGNGSVTVDGPTSSWQISGTENAGGISIPSGLLLGDGSSSPEGSLATLAITRGATVATGWNMIGIFPGGNGSVIVDGADSTLSTSGSVPASNLDGTAGNLSLGIGIAGTGSLTISNGGVVNVLSGARTVNLGIDNVTVGTDSFTGSGSGTLNIGGTAAGTAAAGGILNAAAVTTGAGTGIVQFKTTTALAAPYYFTQDGTGTGMAVAITGATQVVNTAGYTVLSGANPYTGSTTINGGTLADGAANAFSPNSAVSLNSGAALNVNFNEDIAGLDSLSNGAGVVALANAVTLAISNAGTDTFSGVIGGNGALVEEGPGIETLTGVNTYTGGTTIAGGTLAIGADNNLGAVPASAAPGNLVLDGGILRTLSTFTLKPNRGVELGSNGGTFSPDSGTTLTYAGIITGSGSLTKWGGGTLALSGANTYTGDTDVNKGTLAVGNDLALGWGKSKVYLNGGLLTIASGVTLSNPINLTNGGTLGGNGIIGTPNIIVGGNVVLSPGNSPGTLTFAAGVTFGGGGTYDWQIQSVAGAAGTSWDLVSVNGALTITATSGSPFVIKLFSLNVDGVAGSVGDFNSANPYSWTIASATGGINSVGGFNPQDFTIDASGFQNSLGIGSFFVTDNGSNLMMNFTPVPEPSTYGLMAAGLLVLFWRRRKTLRRSS